MTRKIIIFFILLSVFALLLFYTSRKPEEIKYVKIAGESIKVDLAITAPEREKGLAGRQTLDDNEGMLFVFPEPGRHPFWMKDMKIPIDIIWISEDMKVVHIKKNARPESYPETYGGGAEAKYILEVVSGFSERTSLSPGDKVIFTY